MDFAKLTQDIRSSKSDPMSTPPVEKWDPPFCGDMNLVIKNNGQWWHEGTPFTRAKLVKLFASVIKKEADDYFLVTPVEKIRIQVEDVPFIIIDWEYIESNLFVTTQTGDKFPIDQTHPCELRKFDNTELPYVLVRRNLWARVNQNVFYQWVEHASNQQQNSPNTLMMKSGDYRFPIGNF